MDVYRNFEDRRNESSSSMYNGMDLNDTSRMTASPESLSPTGDKGEGTFHFYTILFHMNTININVRIN